MPDADDFDVEYFRNLLQGKTEKSGSAPPAAPAPPARSKPRPPEPATAPAKGRPAAGRKKRGNR